MKNIFFALTLAASCLSAQAQTTQVCKRSPNNTTSCYETKYAQNFKVCKDDDGYYICGRRPAHFYATTPQPMIPADALAENEMDVNNAASYQGYYPQRKSNIKVSYDNVAEEGRAVYEGKPSSQWDGPEKNRQRNLTFPF